MFQAQSIPIPISIICAFDFGKFTIYRLQNAVHWYNSKHVSSDPESSFQQQSMTVLHLWGQKILDTNQYFIQLQ
jgi:hypothetical protein